MPSGGTYRALRLSSWLLVSCGFMALAATPAYSIAILAVPVVLFLFVPLGEGLDTRFPSYHQFVDIAGAMLFAWMFLMWFWGYVDLLPAVIAWVICIEGYLLVHNKRPKHYYYLYLMSFFLLLASFRLEPEAAIGIVFALFLLSASWAMISLHMFIESERHRGASSLDMVPLGRAEATLGPVRARSLDPWLMGTAAVVSLATLALTAALFLVTPRMEAGLFGRDNPTRLVTGISSTVDLTLGGRITLDQRAVMRVEFPDLAEGRFNNTMFWRINTLDLYNNNEWLRQGIKTDLDDPRFALPMRDALISAAQPGDTIQRRPMPDNRPVVHQIVYMDEVPEEGLPCLALVQRAICLGNARDAQLVWDQNRDFAVLMSRRGQRRLQYEVWSEQDVSTNDQLRSAPNNYEERLSAPDYRLLTYHNLDPRTVALARRITADMPTVYDKVAALTAYFSGPDYMYTLDVPLLPSDNPVDAFINDAKRGHCELFASALALMARSIGIPTRVVAGYKGGEYNATDGSYTVRAYHAHLWVEVFFPERGWIVFDPSPMGAEDNPFASTGLSRFFSAYLLKAKMIWYRDVIGYDRGIQVRWLRNLSLGLIGGILGKEEETAAPAASPESSGIVRWLFVAAILAAVFVGAPTIVLVRRSAQARTYAGMLTSDQARARALYRKLRLRLRHLGLEVDGKTAEEIRQETATLALEDPRPVGEVILAYNEVRFGLRPLPPTRYAQLRQTLRKIRGREAGGL